MYPTGNTYIDGVLSGFSWGSGPTNITYNFPTSADYYGANYPLLGGQDAAGGFQAVSPSFQTMVRAALKQYADVSGLTFTQVGAQDDAQISVARTTNFPGSPGTSGFGVYPGAFSGNGDVWFSNSTAAVGDELILSRGTYRLVMHEIGHALGLKHPHETDAAIKTLMPADRDFNDYTIMSYRRYEGGPLQGFANERNWAPQSLMMYDIVAIQEMYGANYSTNAGNTVYAFSATTGEMTVNGVGTGTPGANRIFRTVWDGGGIDTYDFSNYTGANTSNMTIDLTPGGKSIISEAQLSIVDEPTNRKATGNLFNALLFRGDERSLIENVIAGAGNDTIMGNTADNVITGGDGNDIANGGAGRDTFVETFSRAGAKLQYIGGDAWQVRGGGFTDTLTGIEGLKFSDGDIALRQVKSNFNFGSLTNDAGATSDLLVQGRNLFGSNRWIETWIVQDGEVVAKKTVAGTSGMAAVNSGDFNGDGTSDILVRNANGSYSALIMNGEGQGTIASTTALGGAGWSVRGVIDVNADGRQDIVVQRGDSLNVWVAGFGGNSFTDAFIGIVATNNGVRIVGTGDFNGDGFGDVLVRDGTALSVWGMGKLEDGTIVRTSNTVLGELNGATALATGDFNGDGVTDVLLRRGNTLVDWIVTDDGVSEHLLLSTFSSLDSVVGTGDYNGDGRSDIAVRSLLFQSAHLMNSDGTGIVDTNYLGLSLFGGIVA